MYLIVGLGNPTREYEHTRHNIGFDAVELIAGKYGIALKEKDHKAILGKGFIEGEKVILCKPQTYMNLSGESVGSIVNFYKLAPEDEVIIISDDISLNPGQIRVRKKGSAGGHNGLKNIIEHLGTQEFIRIRVGVGEKPANTDLVKHVLGRFSEEDYPKLQSALDDVIDATVTIITDGADMAMNKFNSKKE